MRFFFAIVSVVMLAVVPARADQTDPSLEALFTELRDGSVLDARETTGRIIEIWATAPSPAVNILYERVNESIEMGQLDLAEELSGHVVSLAPSFAQGWVQHAGLMMRLEKQDRAINAYKKALDLEPRHFLATTALADILYASDDYQAAYDLYQQALKWNPHFTPAREEAASLRDKLTGQEI